MNAAVFGALTLRWRCLAAVGVGALYPLAFAPIAARPLAVLSLALFWCLLRGMSSRDAAKIGWCFGAGLFGVGVHWIYHSLHLFGQAIVPLAAAGAAGFVAFVALYPALFAWLQARLLVAFTGPSRELLALPLMWLSLECFREWFSVGFPWLQLGYAGLDTPLQGFAAWGGVFSMTLAAGLLAGAVAAVLCHRRKAPVLLAGLCCVAVVTLAQLAGSAQWGRDAGAPLRVRMVQGNIEQGIKFEPRHLLPSLQKYVDLSFQGDADYDVLIWPETAVPIYFEQAEGFLLPFKEELIGRGAHWLMGGFSWRDLTEETFNTVRVATAEGAVDYHKRNLVPFGEYMPFRWLLDFLRRWVAIPMSDISPGAGQPSPLPLAGTLAAVSICYDDAFGAEVIRQLPQAHYLVNVSNDAWFGDSWAPAQHQEIARLRALETDRALLRATNTGITSFIDRHGRVTASAQPFSAEVLDGEVQPREGETAFVRWGNAPIVALLFGAGAVLLLLSYRRRAP